MLYFSFSLCAQDLQFAQFYSTPLYLNPSFAGSEGCSRIALNYRNEWPAISGTFQTFHLSYDQYVHPIRGGVGFVSWYDVAGEGTLSAYYNGLIYSPKFIVKDNIVIAPSVEFGYGIERLKWDKLSFCDTSGCMIDSRYDDVSDISSFFDISTGILINSEKFYAGIAVAHLNQPKQGFVTSGEARHPMKLTLHGGMIFPISQKENCTSISPTILYQRQQDFQQINLGLFVNKWKITGGLWYRMAEKNSDAFIVGIGFQQGIVKFVYSYDITLSKLSNVVSGSHEVSLRILFNGKNKKDWIIPMPDIMY